MSRPWRIRLPVVLVAALVAAGALWWFTRPEQIPTAVPAGAPPVGSCWTVDPAARDGFFACALTQSTDPGGTGYVRRTGSLKGAGGDGPLAIACVRRGGGDSLAYSPCDGEHDGEFVGTYTLTPPDAPFDATAVAAAVTKGCGQQILKYIGLPADATRPDLHVGYVGPTTAAT